MFEDMMLEDISKRKLTLFKLIIKFSEQTYSINFFANYLDYSYSRIVYLLEQIQQDLSKITNKPVVLLDSNGVHPNKFVSYDSYYQYLITQSIPYQLLVSILYSPKNDLEAFCKINFLSRASVIRKSKLLVDYFKQFDIRLNLSQLKLSGDERNIRLILYCLIWLSSQGMNLPSSDNATINYRDVSAAVSPFFPDSYSYSASKQIKLILDVVYLRIKSGYSLKEKTTLPPYIPSDIDYAENFWSKTITDKDILEAEAQFSAFLLTITPNYFRGNDYRLTFLMNYLKQEHNLATEIMQNFCNFFATQLMTDEFKWDDQPILFGNVANILFSTAILKKPFPTLFHLIKRQSIKENECYQQLFFSFSNFFKKMARQQKFSWLKFMIDDLTESLAYLLLPIFEHALKDNIVRVAIVAESDFLLTRQLTDFLDELTFTRLIAYKEDDPFSFDFIIGTSPYLIPENCNTPSFIFRFTSGTDQYIDLFKALKKAQTHKKIAES
ncbi:helix-turn-helix domain-containing protein [Enterococcus rivorum]|uniref:Mga helix-turn-helix domain-containing protein n=1 Tax=Enterococcus rivorum TaxID=762845 RepID=A0A1E5KW84_9ENTE|nr:helix-turn-helix domain-containing protein [Enterococcus rivorum]MBP2098330.1 hypothetical protein [Enterococcus rivorum]OEH81879.1 hypothetical protein BCR26_03750 [Enterococcus rivorum]